MMAVNRKKRTRSKRRRANPDIRELVHSVIKDAPTAETVAKRRWDVIAALRKTGSLIPEQEFAAEEIQRVFEAWGKVLAMGAQNLAGGSIGNTGRSKDAYLTLSPAEHQIWKNKYIPWAGEASKLFINGRTTVTHQNVVLSVVVENHSPTQIDAASKVARGTAKRALQKSLFRYAEIAGWVNGRGKFHT